MPQIRTKGELLAKKLKEKPSHCLRKTKLLRAFYGVHGPSALPACLAFHGTRPHHKHNEARGEALLALTVLDAEMQQHGALLRQYPELAGVS